MRDWKSWGVAAGLGALWLAGAQAAQLVGLAPYELASSGQQADAATSAYTQSFAAPTGAVLEAIRWWGFHGTNSQGPAFDNLVVTLDGAPQPGTLSIVHLSAFIDEYTLDVADAPLLASSLSIVNDSLDVEWFWQSAVAEGGGPDAERVAFSLLGHRDAVNVSEPPGVMLLIVALALMSRQRLRVPRAGVLRSWRARHLQVEDPPHR